MLFNEPKLLKCDLFNRLPPTFWRRFSALQRAEIAEIVTVTGSIDEDLPRFSALQRAEIAEIGRGRCGRSPPSRCFSALQRAEIAEIAIRERARTGVLLPVSVLFNEPKLLKFGLLWNAKLQCSRRFSALQRAEIAEITHTRVRTVNPLPFQCSSTSRNC